MFGKIKDRLKNIFQNAEDVIEESPDSVEEEVSIPEPKEEELTSPPSPEDIDKKLKEKKSSKKEKKEEKPISESKEENKKKESIEEIQKKTNKVVEIKKLNKSEKDKEETEDKSEIEKLEHAVKRAPGFFHKKEKKEEPISESEKEEEPEEKKGFFSKIFKKKEEEKEPAEEVPIQNEPIEEISEPIEEPQKEEVKEKLPEKIVEEQKKEEKEKLHEDIEKKEPVLEEVAQEKGFFGKTFSKLKAKKITQEDYNKIWFELEIFLLEINIAFDIVEKINKKLQEELLDHSFNRFKLSEKIREVLETQIESVLKTREANLLDEINKIKSETGEPVKILILGVNGTGKTTSIAKIVKLFQDNNLKTVVAAADTFRAAATEQLEEHAKKLDFKLIVHKGGSDPAAVAFDAIEHAKAKNLDVVLIDTAGRMPNNSNLMSELQKIKRVSKSDLSLFIGDSVSGNDLIDQINLFDKGVEINGVILTKVDTDEKPGSIVTTAYECDKPIYYLGVGQNYTDLILFDAKEIAKKLFDTEDEE